MPNSLSILVLSFGRLCCGILSYKRLFSDYDLPDCCPCAQPVHHRAGLGCWVTTSTFLLLVPGGRKLISSPAVCQINVNLSLPANLSSLPFKSSSFDIKMKEDFLVLHWNTGVIFQKTEEKNPLECILEFLPLQEQSGNEIIWQA